MRRGTPFDVAIVGAGPAGASLAIALSRAGYEVCLLHRSSENTGQRGAFRPVEALAAPAQIPLQALGVWDRLRGLQPLPSDGQVARWGSGQTVEQPGFFNSYGPSWHIDRTRFDALLRAAAVDAGAVLTEFQGLSDVAVGEDVAWQLRLRDGRTIAAAFLVDASGRARVLARRLGARVERPDDLIALMATLPRRAQSSTLVLETTPLGWWYALPGPDGQCTVALMTDPATARQAHLRSAAGWADALRQTALIWQAADIAAGLPPPPLTMLAGAGMAEPTGGEKWLAIGDAAVSYDPLAGIGVTRALWDGLRSAEAISAAANGNTAALSFHRQAQIVAYRRHVQQKRDYYGLEQRWPQQAFWRNRAAEISSARDQAAVLA